MPPSDAQRCVFFLKSHFSLSFSQFQPELIIISAGYDSALGDEKVVGIPDGFARDCYAFRHVDSLGKGEELS